MNPPSTQKRSRRFALVLVKPAHYDDEGYVIQWLRSAIPSNSLAALFGLARDCGQRGIFGDDVELEIHPFDETNTRIRPEKLARLIEDAGSGVVMMVGVQSNQFPRALDLAKPLLERGVQVAIGGFHVSGTLSMLQGNDPDLHRARAMGISLYAGEAEGRFDEVLLDAFHRRLKPLYNYMADLPGIEGAPIPLITATKASRTAGGLTTFDAGRGCPFQCSFCTIINVQGRKSRRRSPDDIEKIIRENWAQGLHSFFVTDDNFARNQDWEPILDRIIKLRREEHIDLSLVLQVDTLCHKIPKFIKKCKSAGVKRVFIGLENINPDNLLAAKKKQNKITEYRKMLLAWKEARILTYAGYITGFPNDTPESIARDIEIIKKELPVDLLEFFYLTPLPGSEDHQTLTRAGVQLDADLNRYDLVHTTAPHSKMSREEWERAYWAAWNAYYTDEHMETVLRRLAAKKANASNAVTLLTWFKGSVYVEGIHPLEGGVFRKKYRRDRRPGFPILPRWKFYPAYAVESVVKLAKWVRIYRKIRKTYLRIMEDPKRFDYMDQALTPVTDDELENLEIFHTRSAEFAVERERRQRAKEAAAAA